MRRYARTWRRDQVSATAAAYVPLSFAPGEAYQFDWSYEIVLIGGTTVTVKVAHLRLCHSRMLFVRAYPRETQEMVFDAHDRAFAFFKGACTRGIYDNLKAAVDAIFVGRERAYNRRFLQMCSHYLVEPVACTPASGWEKGQVENQVGLVRERFFSGRGTGAECRCRFGSPVPGAGGAPGQPGSAPRYAARCRAPGGQTVPGSTRRNAGARSACGRGRYHDASRHSAVHVPPPVGRGGTPRWCARWRGCRPVLGSAYAAPNNKSLRPRHDSQCRHGRGATRHIHSPVRVSRSHSAWAAGEDSYVNRSGSWRYISRRFLSSSIPSSVKALMASSLIP